MLAEKSLTVLLRTAMILCREPAVERPDIGEAADAEAWNAALCSAFAAESEAQLLCSPPAGPLAGTLRARDVKSGLHQKSFQKNSQLRLRKNFSAFI